jgi:hypothetical protein
VVGVLFGRMIAPLERFTHPIFWLEQIPPSMKLDDDKVVKLERLRRRYALGNEEFLLMVLSSPAITRKVQENLYSIAKEQMPDASEEEVLKAVFRCRLFPQHPLGLQLTDDEIQAALQGIKSLNDLKQYFVEMDEKLGRVLRDPFGIGRKVANKIDQILER